MMPGRNGTITVLLKKRYCSWCGQHSFRKNDWCPHLIKAGRSMNMKFDNITPRRRNLRELRRGARLEKVPGGSKRNQSLRKFDIVPLHTQLNNDQVQQEIIQDFNARISGQQNTSTPEQPRSKRRLQYNEPAASKRPRTDLTTQLIDGVLEDDINFLPEPEPQPCTLSGPGGQVQKPQKPRTACTFPGCQSTFSQKFSMLRHLGTLHKQIINNKITHRAGPPVWRYLVQYCRHC